MKSQNINGRTSYFCTHCGGNQWVDRTKVSLIVVERVTRTDYRAVCKCHTCGRRNIVIVDRDDYEALSIRIDPNDYT